MKYLVFFVNAICISVFFLFNKYLPPEIPIYHSAPWGEARLGDKWSFFIILAIFNISYFATSYIGRSFFKGDKFITTAITLGQVVLFVLFIFCNLRLLFVLY